MRIPNGGTSWTQTRILRCVEGNLLQASELHKLEWSRYIAGLLCSRMGSLQGFTEQTEKGNGVVLYAPGLIPLLFALRSLYDALFSSLRSILWPFLAHFTRLWELYIFRHGQSHMEYVRQHEKNGMIFLEPKEGPYGSIRMIGLPADKLIWIFRPLYSALTSYIYLRYQESNPLHFPFCHY